MFLRTPGVYLQKVLIVERSPGDGRGRRLGDEVPEVHVIQVAVRRGQQVGDGTVGIRIQPRHKLIKLGRGFLGQGELSSELVLRRGVGGEGGEGEGGQGVAQTQGRVEAGLVEGVIPQGGRDGEVRQDAALFVPTLICVEYLVQLPVDWLYLK